MPSVEADHNVQVPRKEQKISRPAKASVALVLVLIVSYFIYRAWPLQGHDSSLRKSIAVLPFDNLNDQTGQEYFGDGIADEIINLLARRSDLDVIARSSSFQFKGKKEDLRVIGDKLGVEYIIWGNVQREGDNVRMVTQLNKASDGSHIWSNTYNLTVENMLNVQDEIANAVSEKLNVSLSEKVTDSDHFRSYEAKQLYLLGKRFTDLSTLADLKKADSVLRLAAAIEPGNAKIWSALASVYILQENNGFEDKIGPASEAAFKAIELDSRCADAHSVLGYINTTYWYKWEEAEQNLNKALSLEPTNATAMYRLGLLYSALGNYDMAIEMQKNSIRHDPLNMLTHTWLTFNYIYTERYDDARKSLKTMSELAPTPDGLVYLTGIIELLEGKTDQAIETISKERRGDWRTFGLAQAYYLDGQIEKANQMRDEMLKNYGSIAPFQIGEIYGLRGDADEAFAWFDKAFEARMIDFIVLKKSPWLKKITNDPRYAMLLKKLNLPPD